jgi:large subunit ribosomal protein L31e
MATPETPKIEREYVIPIRRAILKVPRYERTRIAIRTIKRFIAKHMKIPDRDLKKVKLDVFLNNEIWFRGRKNPPTKIKVKAIKQEDIVRVNFIQTPEYVKFLKPKVEKRHAEVKKPEKPAPVAPAKDDKDSDKKEEKPDHKPPEQTPKAKKEEQEKSKAVAEQREKQAQLAAKAQKHMAKGKQPQIQRKALKK